MAKPTWNRRLDGHRERIEQPPPGAEHAWYVHPAVSGRRTRSCAVLAGIAAAFLLSSCGGQAEQNAGEPSGIFPVQVTTATFPASQRLAEHTRLVIAVRNAGQKAIPDIAVTITDPRRGTSVQAFGRYITMPGLASHSRPVWIVDRPPGPGPCFGPSGYSCRQGGPGGAVTAYANTWALGTLQPGHSTTFVWGVTAVVPGIHLVHYRIAAGLNGNAKARLSGGAIPQGTFTVSISSKPVQSYVTSTGKIVTTGQ